MFLYFFTGVLKVFALYGVICALVDIYVPIDESFIPLEWFGKEITDSLVGRDKSLISLNKEDFDNLILELKQ